LFPFTIPSPINFQYCFVIKENKKAAAEKQQPPEMRPESIIVYYITRQ